MYRAFINQAGLSHRPRYLDVMEVLAWLSILKSEGKVREEYANLMIQHGNRDRLL